MNDVIERIDQLAAEEKCPHCERDWHELALTQYVAKMFEGGTLTADYFTREDTSPMVCEGSKFIGPVRPKAEYSYASGGGIYGATGTFLDSSWSVIGTTWDAPQFTFDGGNAWTSLAIQSLQQGYYGSTFTFVTNPSAPWVIWQEPEPLECEAVPDGIEVEFGPQHWIPAQEPVHAPPAVTYAVGSWMPEFVAIETHAPPSPGLDFTDVVEQINNEFKKYPTGKKVMK